MRTEQQRIAMMARLDTELARRKLDLYAPYAKQREFHKNGASYSERLFMAGNQLGKCSHKSSLIDTPSGPVKVSSLKDGDIVMAWDGHRKVPAAILAPFKKPGLHECALVVMSDGRTIAVADHHRILLSDGWRLLSQILPKTFFLQCAPTRQCCLLTHASDALHWLQKLVGSTDRCSEDCRQCDGQPQEAQEIGPASALQQAGVLQRTGHNEHLGGQAHTQTDSLLSICDRHSSLGGLRLFAARAVGWIVQAACRLSEPSPQIRPAFQRLRGAVGAALQSAGEVLGQALGYAHEKNGPWESPDVDGNRIIAVIPIGRHEVYDFTVPGLHNYCAAGLVHHNTIAGGAEWAMHLTGRYPDWWEGATFNKAPLLWAGSVTGESTRDNPQRILMGPANLEEMWGTGFIPASCIKDRTRAMGVPNLLDSVVVRWGGGGDIQASESVVAFKAYEKGREKWQGPTVDGVWFDEEPPQDIYTEGLTRTNRGQRGQFAQTTFTPLLGMSEVVSKFLLPDEGDAGAKSRIVTTMTIEDVEHYTPEERAKIIASYPAHERKARASGIPILGSGRIFPLEDDAVSCKPFPIPDYWPRINGLDFGWDHPSAAVQLAWDRDSDCLYITHAHRLREALPVVHASTIKAWGAWVPTAWPHDGLQHDKGSGEQLAKLYKNAGLVMCRERATFEDGTNGVEAGLMDMLERMMTGRLKVFSHLEDWFSEFRLYHRKDGKVVKKVDDLMAATRYAVMMRRKAIVKINKDAAITPGFDPLDPEMGY